MSDAQTILKMIEEVDPADTAKLDEIDARVYEFLDFPDSNIGCPEYTRSRDSLKSIRPEGWGFNNYYHYKHGIDSQLHSCSAGHWKVNQWENTIFAEALPTEELAELHAIIQAIDHERGRK